MKMHHSCTEIALLLSVVLCCGAASAVKHVHKQHHRHGAKLEQTGAANNRIAAFDQQQSAQHHHAHHFHSQEATQFERVEDGAGGHLHHDYEDSEEHHAEFDHEAILGSVKEAEEFDSLPPEEAKRRLEVLLKKMDLNEDGLIERHELRAWILRSFKMLSEEESAERFLDSDEDSDGFVTWKEYLSEAFNIDDNQVDQKGDPSESQMIADDRMLFEAADTDQDGKLSKTEFVKFTHPEEHAEMLPVILEQTLREKDKNNDGVIDFQEFAGERAVEYDKEWLLVEKEKFDSDYDKNSDGKLDSNEILSWVIPSNYEIADDEVSHLFSSADNDVDGILSFAEILDNHDVFVGSEATDYGDHLQNIHQFTDEL